VLFPVGRGHYNVLIGGVRSTLGKAQTKIYIQCSC
jgi:hypothetical protein